jgi:hypothetical protein
MANTLHAYVNASVFVFLRVTSVAEEIFEAEPDPRCMSGAFQIAVKRHLMPGAFFFSKAFDAMYTFRNLGRLPKIQKPK